MAVRGLNLDWRKKPVVCSECGSALMRRLYHPKTGSALGSFFCNFQCKGLWQKRAKPVDEVWLRQKYLVERLTAPEIAKIVGRDSKGVYNWLVGYGIPTRPRGSYKPPGFGGANFTGHKHSDQSKQRIREARKADGHFPKSPDGSPYWRGRTGVDHPAWNGGLTPERQAFYSTDEWKRARRTAYTNAGGKCQRCGAGSAEITLHIHHVVPFIVRRLRASPGNLRVLCKICHRFVHSDANGDREFLPWFGVMRFDQDGKHYEIPVNYKPKKPITLPTWLRSENASPV